MKVTNICQLDGKQYTMEINCTEAQLQSGIAAYQQGALLQSAFPFLSAGEREFLKTGITPEKWEEMFGPDEE